MNHIFSEIKQEKFDFEFQEGEEIPEHMKKYEFWRDCCLNFTISKVRLLEYLYKQAPKDCVPREELYPLLKKIGYKRRRVSDVIKELEKEGFIVTQNGSIITNKNAKIIRNTQVMLALWGYANEPKKPKGAKKNKELRHTIHHHITNSWKSLRRIVKDYSKNQDLISRTTIQKALDEQVGKAFQRKTLAKGKYKAHYYKLL